MQVAQNFLKVHKHHIQGAAPIMRLFKGLAEDKDVVDA